MKGCFENIDYEFISQVTPFIPKHILWEWSRCGSIEMKFGEETVQPTLSGVRSSRGYSSPPYYEPNLRWFRTLRS